MLSSYVIIITQISPTQPNDSRLDGDWTGIIKNGELETVYSTSLISLTRFLLESIDFTLQNLYFIYGYLLKPDRM
jgi:hypothetical protein